MTSIGDGAFSGCNGLTSVTIPEDVTSIGSYAFSGCSGLTSITIPEGVTSIGYRAFDGCSGLTSVTIPEGVTRIRDYAFIDCCGLISITIPKSVSALGYSAFAFCRSLTSVHVKSEIPVPIINNGVFTNRSNATLYVPKGSKEAYEAAAYWNEFKEIIEVEPEPEPGNALYMEPAEAIVGIQSNVSLRLRNEISVAGYSFELALPEGVSIATNGNGKLVASLAGDRHSSHTLLSNQVDGVYRFAVFSASGDEIDGTDGDAITLTLAVDGDMAPGEYTIGIQNVRFSTPEAQSVAVPSCTVTLTVLDVTLGDVNSDGQVDIADAIAVVNIILGKNGAQAPRRDRALDPQ